MGKFNDYSDAGTLQPTDLLPISRSPFTPGTFFTRSFSGLTSDIAAVLGVEDIFIYLKPIVSTAISADEYQVEASTWGNNGRVLTFPVAKVPANAVGSKIISGNVGTTNYAAIFICRTDSSSTNPFQLYISAVIRNQNDPFDITYGTATSTVITPTGTPEQTIVSTPTLAFTPNGSGTGVHQIEWRVFRLPGTGFDTLNADIDLVGCLVYPTT